MQWTDQFGDFALFVSSQTYFKEKWSEGTADIEFSCHTNIYRSTTSCKECCALSVCPSIVDS
jgi:hypothetical protein